MSDFETSNQNFAQNSTARKALPKEPSPAQPYSIKLSPSNDLVDMVSHQTKRPAYISVHKLEIETSEREKLQDLNTSAPHQ
jgi:EAL domain-containing protein (putative c-di-GMP-specific phosphodiesterase class I)